MGHASEVSGTYGSGTPCIVLIYPQRNGATWYAVEGSQNVNCTFEPVEDGVNVEALSDHDTFQADAPVNDADDLYREVEECE